MRSHPPGRITSIDSPHQDDRFRDRRTVDSEPAIDYIRRWRRRQLPLAVTRIEWTQLGKPVADRGHPPYIENERLRGTAPVFPRVADDDGKGPQRRQRNESFRPQRIRYGTWIAVMYPAGSVRKRGESLTT